MKTGTILGAMTGNGVIYQLIIEDCTGYSVNLEYQKVLESCGARIQDFIIDFRSKRIRYYITLNITWEEFSDRLSHTPIWGKISKHWRGTRGITEL